MGERSPRVGADFRPSRQRSRANGEHVSAHPTSSHSVRTVPPFNTLGYNVVRGILLPTVPTFPHQ